MDEPTAQAMTPVATETSAAEMPVETTPAAAAQTPEATPQEPAKVDPPVSRKSLRDLIKEDPDIKREFDEEHNRGVQKALSKKDREIEKARLARAVEDPVEALTYSQERKQQLDAEDSAETGQRARWQAVANLVKETAAKHPDWKTDYDEVIAANRKEADTLFAKDPDQFQDWVDNQIFDLRVERKVQKVMRERLPTLVDAKATDEANRRLSNLPILPTGNGAPGMGDDAYLAAYSRGEVSDHKRARELLARLK